MSVASTGARFAIGAAIIGAMGAGAFALAGPAAAAPVTYPGTSCPTGYGSGGSSGGSAGINTTNPDPGSSITVTTSCCPGDGNATLSWDGTQIATSPVSNGSASLTGNVPTGASGAHVVTAQCFDGVTATFDVNVASASQASGDLASTGAKVIGFTGLGVLLVGGGVVLLVVSRRRSTTV